jgi:hypothetical protein
MSAEPVASPLKGLRTTRRRHPSEIVVVPGSSPGLAIIVGARWRGTNPIPVW